MQTKTLQSAAAATGNGTTLNVTDDDVCLFNVTGTFVGTVAFECSNDNSNWVPLPVTNIASAVVATTATATGQYVANVNALRFVRARVSAYTSGSITVVSWRRGGTVGPFWLTDASGNLKFTEATLHAGEDLTNDVQKVENRYSYAYIATATTTQVKSGSGFLHAITVNTTAAGAISVIDNTSGSTVNIGSLKASVAEGTYVYNVSFSTGLRIITAGASDITVSYR